MTTTQTLITYRANGTELFTEFTGSAELVELYGQVVRNYTELKLSGDFTQATLVASDARNVSDRLIRYYGATEAWILERCAEAEAKAFEISG